MKAINQTGHDTKSKRRQEKKDKGWNKKKKSKDKFHVFIRMMMRYTFSLLIKINFGIYTCLPKL